jgi:hypothetical protein
VDAEMGGEIGMCWLYRDVGVKLTKQNSERGEEYGHY